MRTTGPAHFRRACAPVCRRREWVVGQWPVVGRDEELRLCRQVLVDEQARLVKTIPNPAKDWIKAAGPNAKKVLVAYMDSVRATGFKFPRDFDKE